MIFIILILFSIVASVSPQPIQISNQFVSYSIAFSKVNYLLVYIASASVRELLGILLTPCI